MTWLASTLDRWIVDRSYEDLLTALTPGELRRLAGQAKPSAARELRVDFAVRDQQDQGTATVRYEQIRGAALSFEQLLTQLILGLWMGGTARAVEIARGNDPNLVPRRILTLQVRAAPLDGDRSDSSPTDLR